MTITTGRRLGPYEIISRIGAGGMGEVFRARDTRLDRNVAIKVLPAQFADDAELKLRFEREARMISQLNHPHICTLYDVGEDDGTEFLVMELLEGETLADRIVSGPLPLDEVLSIGIQIADALDKAHRQGIVHRDLKPGNVMLTKSGAKLLDFGLAKAGVRSSFHSRPTGAAAEPKRLTQKGIIVGTFGYMAPEQLAGADANPRSDIFALGAVLYEMASGRPAFEGVTPATLIAATTAAQPSPLFDVRPELPPALDHVVQRCLNKDPEDRWQSANDIAAQLKWIQRSSGSSVNLAGPPTVVQKAVKPRLRSCSSVTLIVAAVALAIGWGFAELWRDAPPVITSSIVAPPNLDFQFRNGAPVLSPEGSRVVFPARSKGGQRLLWLRRLSGGSAAAIAGTDDATHPFWSPDGQFIGFFAEGKLKKVVAAGGPVQTLCDAPSGRGGTWSSGDTIVFAPEPGEALMLVPSTGGVPRPVTKLDASRRERGHRFPYFLPDGEHFLYYVEKFGQGSARIALGSTGGDAPQELAESASNAVYADGHILYVREMTLVAQPFDEYELKLGAAVMPVAEAVIVNERNEGAFSVAQNGLLAWVGGAVSGNSELKWVGADGSELATVGNRADYATPALSHDGNRVAVSIRKDRNFDIWVLDLQLGTSTRLTFDAADETFPRWSPEGDRILYTSTRSGSGDLMIKRSSGAGPEETLYASAEHKIAYDWSRDGRFVAFQELSSKAKTDWDIWLYSIADRKATPLLDTRFGEQSPSLSPDGKWLAYNSNESGQAQIYVQAVSGRGGKWQITTDGGVKSSWSADGKQLYYANGTTLYAAEIFTSGDDFRSRAPRAVAELPRMKTASGLQYAVAPDGRILVNMVTDDRREEPITLVQNWPGLIAKP